MEIQITDQKAFNIYSKYLNVPAEQAEVSEENPYSFEVTEFGEGTPKERWEQLFAHEAIIGDGNLTLSADEAVMVDAYYKSTNPGLRAIFRPNHTPLNDPKLEKMIEENTYLGFLEWFASELPGDGAREDFLTAVVRYPELAILIHPKGPDILFWITESFKILEGYPEDRQKFLEIIGTRATNQVFYEPMEFCLARNRSAFRLQNVQLFDQVSHFMFQQDPAYHQRLEDPTTLLELANDPNHRVVGDALIHLAEMKIEKDVILDKLNNPGDFGYYGFYIYTLALEALAIWGDEESVQILEDTIIYGSFQAHVMAIAAMHKHFSADQLVDTIERLLYDSDPFVRGAGLKLLQFVWHKEGFEEYSDCFYEEVKNIIQSDPNKYVRMAAVECLGYSHRAELATLDYLVDDPELLPFTISAVEHYKGKTMPTGYSDPIDFLSSSYHYPIQSKWITESLREMAKEGAKNLKVLMLGCSYGLEAWSLLVEIMKDYEADPSAWGDFEPAHDLKIIISDIDTQVLLYAQRGYYHFDGTELDNEFSGMRFYHDVYGSDFESDFGHFFEPAPASLAAIDQYHLSKPYSNMLEVRYLDITNPAEEPLADVVTFNRLDYLWGDSPRATAAVYTNAFQLSSRYLTYLTWENTYSQANLLLYGTPVHTSGPFGFYEKKLDYYDPKITSALLPEVKERVEESLKRKFNSCPNPFSMSGVHDNRPAYYHLNCFGTISWVLFGEGNAPLFSTDDSLLEELRSQGYQMVDEINPHLVNEQGKITGLNPQLALEEFLPGDVLLTTSHADKYRHGVLFLNHFEGASYVFHKQNHICETESPFKIANLKDLLKEDIGRPYEKAHYKTVLVYRQ